MSGLNGVLNTDLTGLEAYRAALATVAENTANATTPGYASRSVSLAAQYQSVDQVVGNGVQVTGVNRAYSSFTSARLRAALSSQGSADTLVQALDTLQSNFSSGSGITAALGQFFSDAKSLANKPNDLPTRQTLIADGQQLAAAFNTASGNLRDSIQNLGQQASGLTKQANQLLGQLAAYNQQLRSRGGQNTNTLLDNQSAALQSLSKLIGFNAIRHSNGTVRLSVKGQVLLDSAGAATLSVRTGSGAGTPPQLDVSNGHPLSVADLSGSIGGALTAASQSQAILQRVDRMATVTATLVNNQQALGLSGNGIQGGALFNLPAPTVIASPVNTGTATLSAQVTNAAALPADGGPYALRYDGTQWHATNQASGKTTTVGSGTTLSFNGIQVNVSGSASAGDTFTVDPVAGAAGGIQMATSDPASLAAAAPYVATDGTVSASGIVSNTNAGTGKVHQGSVTTTTTPAGVMTVPSSYFGSNLQVKFTSATAYQVQTSSGTVIASGSYTSSSGGVIDIAYPSGAAGGKYWQMNISGAPAAGDVFTLSPGGSGSGANADALGQLDTAPIMQGGSLNDAWSGVTGTVGTVVKSAQTSQSNAQTTVQSAKSADDNVSGVSLDQQAGNLQLYQQAYQATAKSIAVVNQLFQGLLGAV